MKRPQSTGCTETRCYTPAQKQREVNAMPFPEKVAKLRKEKGLTQNDLAKKAGVAVFLMRERAGARITPDAIFQRGCVCRRTHLVSVTVKPIRER